MNRPKEPTHSHGSPADITPILCPICREPAPPGSGHEWVLRVLEHDANIRAWENEGGTVVGPCSCNSCV